MAATNKRLLISESCGDSNRCTPCRGKPDQHDMYASHASPRTPGVRFLRAIHIHGNHSLSRQRRRMDPTAPKN
jgi:ferredoxin